MQQDALMQYQNHFRVDPSTELQQTPAVRYSKSKVSLAHN
jgi:hypothetical protein